ncbi:MAG TPA: AMP-binding protein [Polyangiaceae bacterium]|nr:AMP-binding protein [Polyangiaceae bacterium]
MPTNTALLFAHPDTIPGAFARQARQRGDAPALLGRTDAGWQSLTWRECSRRSELLASGLLRLGLQPGECVALVLRTRPEWALLELAVFLAGGVTTSIYPENPAERQAFMLRDSGARIAVCEDAEQLGKLLAHASDLPELRRLIALDAPGANVWPATLRGSFVRRALEENPHFLPSLSQLAALGESELERQRAELELRAATLQSDALATLLYTSGTTRVPKGVRLSHASLLASGRSVAAHRAPWRGAGEPLSIVAVPCAHIMARIGLFGSYIDGMPVALEPRPERLVQSCAEVGATGFATAPACCERLYARLRTEPSGSLLRLLGGRVCSIWVGSAALPTHVTRWFWGEGVPLLECYGSTECGFVSGCSPEHHALGSVGQPTPGTRMRLGADGEILVNGPSTMLGYHQRPEDDSAAIEWIDGERWLHTRDIGRLDPDGSLWIIGRKDDLFKTSMGGYISPEYLQCRLKDASPLISRALIYGAGHPHVVALLTLDPTALQLWAAEHAALDAGSLHRHPALRATLERQVAACNERLSPHERIAAFMILERELSSAENELTELGKPRRALIFEKHRAQLEGLYAARAASALAAPA